MPKLAAGLLLALALPALAQVQDWTLDALMQQLAQVRSQEGTFAESRNIALLKEPLELQGTLSYRRPDRVTKHTLAPFDERLSLEGDVLTIENRTKGETRRVALQQNPVAWGIVAGLRSALAGDRAQLVGNYRAELSGTRESWSLALRPLDRRVSDYLKALTLSGSGSRVTRVEIEETNGDRAVMIIRTDGG